jgi:hypothetical protein
MDSNQENFHIKALNSILFKGHSDWYFCFLKAERIAHALTLLARQTSDTSDHLLRDTARLAVQMPEVFLHFATEDLSPEAVLADLFSLLSSIRLCATAKAFSGDNATVLIQECQALIERFASSIPASPFLSPDDFAVPTILPGLESSLASYTTHRIKTEGEDKKDTLKDFKGHKGIDNKGRSERTQNILDFVLQREGVSIKDILAGVGGYGEKTVQRELALLVRQGLVKKVGERRWSIYLPA